MWGQSDPSVRYCDVFAIGVLLVSTYVKRIESDEDTGRPSIVEHYSETKGGTDTFDTLCHLHSVSRAANRWPRGSFLEY